MAHPIPGVGISTPYGKRGGSWSCNEDPSGAGVHTGVDFACVSGTQIYAPIAGQVRHRAYGSAFGNHQFSLSPDPGQPFEDGEVFFAHTQTRPSDGVYVNIGDPIALVGNEGNSTGPHLHMEYHPSSKNAWNCYVHADPQPVIDHESSTAPSPSNGPYVTADVYSNKVGYGEPSNGDESSDTVKELQERLNRISLVGGETLPITGAYWEQTDEEVRLWQEQIVGDPPDPVNASYLGPNQFAAMFPSPPYVRHDVGLPAVAGGSSGGNGSGGGGTAPPVDPPVDTPPAAPALVYPFAYWDPVTKDGGGYFTGLRPFVGTACKITLHTTETSVKPNWDAQQSGIPHFTIDLVSDQCWQHLPLDMAAYTLSGGDHSPNSDSGPNIQIEIVGYATDAMIWDTVQYTRLEALLDWICDACEVPWSFPVFFGGYGMSDRLSWEAWESCSGILGHQHAPYNDHWDPGALNTAELGIIHEPSTGEPPIDEVPPDEEEDWFDKLMAFLDDYWMLILVIAFGVAFGIWLYVWST